MEECSICFVDSDVFVCQSCGARVCDDCLAPNTEDIVCITCAVEAAVIKRTEGLK